MTLSLTEFRQLLRQTLDDRQMSRSERKALSTVLDEAELPGGDLDKLRGEAFDLAREALGSAPHAAAVLDWLADVVRTLKPAGEPASSRAEACFSPGPDCRKKIRELFGLARTSVDVCVFTITDDEITQAIAAAHQRGVRLRILTDNDKSLDLGSDIQELRRLGVDVREDITPHHMHHKFAIFDESLLLTGSYNWTRSAADHNEENFILTSDTRLVRRFNEVFREMWERFAV